jgi:hypothetical protein
VVPGSPADFGKLIADETEKWAKVIKFAGIKADYPEQSSRKIFHSVRFANPARVSPCQARPFHLKATSTARCIGGGFQKDKHALETLPAKVAAIEAKIARSQRVMSDPTLFARDRVTFDITSRALAGAQAEFVAAEEPQLLPSAPPRLPGQGRRALRPRRRNLNPDPRRAAIRRSGAPQAQLQPPARPLTPVL